MATARDQLFDTLMLIMRETSASQAYAYIEEVLNLFRVQVKNKVDKDPSRTARDELYFKMQGYWEEGRTLDSSDDDADKKFRESCYDLIQKFRIQFKAKSQPTFEAFRNQLKSNSMLKDAEDNRKVIDTSTPSSTSPTNTQKKEETHTQPQPLAGGPRSAKSERGECPKCKSKGVTRSSAYGADDYLSCVYCGWQGFLPKSEGKESSLVDELLYGRK